jgi:O-antigen ligase
MVVTIKNTLLLVIFTLLCAGSLFPTSSLFVNEQITPKWYCTVFCSAFLLLTYIAFSFMKKEKGSTIEKSILIICLTIIIFLCTMQAFYGIFQYFEIFPSVNGFRITGSFDNPAGFAASLCAGFPFLFYFVFHKEKWIRRAAITAGIIIITAIILSASRAGIVSLIVVCSVIFFYKIKIATGWKLTIITTLLFVSLSNLYFLKKDSADGRILIWRCSWEMMKDKPLFGHGCGGFRAGYMNYQANYFEQHPDSKYVMLADNVNRPFNEYIGFAVNYGLAGWILLWAAGWFLWKSFLRCKNNIQARMAVCCLLSVAVFAFFSYPLRYPFVWVIMILSIVLIIYCAEYQIKIPDMVIHPALVLLIPAIIFAGRVAYQRMMDEVLWCKTANQSLLGKTEQMLPVYKCLHQSLAKNELFLYNYAAELNVAKRYGESLQIARKCEQFWADYDLQLLMADNYERLQQYKEAERYYERAAAMCPVKFAPLYELANLYLATGQTVEALTLAQKIVDKKIKIPSATVSAIKNKMQELLNEQDTGIPTEEKGWENDVSQNKIQSGQAFPAVNQTPAGRLPP